MSGHLLDTNVVSELRKGKRANANVLAWFQAAEADELFLSVLVLGEIRKGIELVRSKDRVQAQALERWLTGLQTGYADRILPVTSAIAETWGRVSVATPPSLVDGLMAATALEHDLILVTRNVDDVKRTGVAVFNPFASARRPRTR